MSKHYIKRLISTVCMQQTTSTLSRLYVVDSFKPRILSYKRGNVTWLDDESLSLVLSIVSTTDGKEWVAYRNQELFSSSLLETKFFSVAGSVSGDSSKKLLHITKRLSALISGNLLWNLILFPCSLTSLCACLPSCIGQDWFRASSCTCANCCQLVSWAGWPEAPGHQFCCAY